MRTIKIYSKSYVELTTFFEFETTRTQYKKTVGKTGTAEFTIRLDNEKSTTDNLRHYNRISIIEDGVVKFWGIISELDIDLDVVRVRCLELVHILEKRIVGDDYATNGTASAVITDLMNQINADEDTGISIGNLAVSSTVNNVYNYADVLTILKSIGDSTSSQFFIDNDRKLNFLSEIGSDVSDTVIFEYDIDQKQSANILSFSVRDSGDSIVTKAFGKSDSRTSTQEDTAGQAKYGIIESYTDFRVANSQDDLDDFTNASLMQNEFSPDVKLSPRVEDNFEIGDKIRVKIKNKLVDIDDNYQVLEKKVEYLGDQKRLSITISDLPTQFLDKVKDIDERLKLLEENL